MILCCDFETENKEEDCRVWSFGCMNLKEEYWEGDTLPEFFDVIFSIPGKSHTLYFHNANFDFSFMEYYIVKVLGLVWTDEKKIQEGQYTSLISDMGAFYYAEFVYRGKRIKIVDSGKIFYCKLEEIPKMLGLKGVKKGYIEYNKPHPIGYERTQDEREYQRQDCYILKETVVYMRAHGYKKLTLASNSLFFFKKSIGTDVFKKLFPVLPTGIDAFLRRSYKGGLCMVNPHIQGKIVGRGRVYDINSSYPFHNTYSMLPYGVPVRYTGAYKQNKTYPLYVQHLFVDCTLKNGHAPCIILKEGIRVKNTMLLDTDGEEMELVLTNIDLDMLLEHYDIYSIDYVDGYMFRASNRIFREYFEQIFTQKIDAIEQKNIGLRTDAKLRMNNIGGKFGTNPIAKRKVPYYDRDDDIIRYNIVEDMKDSVYVAVISFITAYGRQELVRAIHLNIDRFLYCDTDSMHLLGDVDAVGIEVDKTKIGAWDLEMTFERGKYLHQKTYCEEYIDVVDYTEDDEGYIRCIEADDYQATVLKSNVKCAGLPNAGKIKNITCDDFKPGAEFKRLKSKRVSGGVILYDYIHTLK